MGRRRGRQSALRRRFCAEIATLDRHQAAKRIDQALMVNFSKRLLYMAKRTLVNAPSLLVRWWATVCSSRMACWQGARWETDLWWVVLNDLVDGANACLRTFQRLWQAMKTKSVPQPQPTESHFEQTISTMFRNRFGLVQKIKRVLKVHGLHLPLTSGARDSGTDVAGGSRRRRRTQNWEQRREGDKK